MESLKRDGLYPTENQSLRIDYPNEDSLHSFKVTGAPHSRSEIRKSHSYENIQEESSNSSHRFVTHQRIEITPKAVSKTTQVPSITHSDSEGERVISYLSVGGVSNVTGSQSNESKRVIDCLPVGGVSNVTGGQSNESKRVVDYLPVGGVSNVTVDQSNDSQRVIDRLPVGSVSNVTGGQSNESNRIDYLPAEGVSSVTGGVSTDSRRIIDYLLAGGVSNVTGCESNDRKGVIDYLLVEGVSNVTREAGGEPNDGNSSSCESYKLTPDDIASRRLFTDKNFYKRYVSQFKGNVSGLTKFGSTSTLVSDSLSSSENLMRSSLDSVQSSSENPTTSESRQHSSSESSVRSSEEDHKKLSKGFKEKRLEMRKETSRHLNDAEIERRNTAILMKRLAEESSACVQQLKEERRNRIAKDKAARSKAEKQSVEDQRKHPKPEERHVSSIEIACGKKTLPEDTKHNHKDQKTAKAKTENEVPAKVKNENRVAAQRAGNDNKGIDVNFFVEGYNRTNKAMATRNLAKADKNDEEGSKVIMGKVTSNVPEKDGSTLPERKVMTKISTSMPRSSDGSGSSGSEDSDNPEELSIMDQYYYISKEELATVTDCLPTFHRPGEDFVLIDNMRPTEQKLSKKSRIQMLQKDYMSQQGEVDMKRFKTINIENLIDKYEHTVEKIGRWKKQLDSIESHPHQNEIIKLQCLEDIESSIDFADQYLYSKKFDYEFAKEYLRTKHQE